MRYNHIELFAGCGGLSLGLEKAGFELLLANELSPMASETFAYNFFGEDLKSIAERKQLPQHTIWLSSQFSELKERLRENPLTFPSLETERTISDIPSDASELKGKLVVGSIVQLNKLINDNELIKETIRSGFTKGGVDLVSGGPPCQSFSMAGMRRKECDKNMLPWEFAKFVTLSNPKVALLENVTGILRPFTEDNGHKFYAWFEVAKVFASIGYVPICLHINARLVGIPQNRPRFIMISIREDVCNKLLASLNDSEHDFKIIMASFNFYLSVKECIDSVTLDSIPLHDISAGKDVSVFKKSQILHHLVLNDYNSAVSVCEALDDIKVNNPSEPSVYVNKINRIFNGNICHSNNDFCNHEFRSNSKKVRARFRIYQVINLIDDKKIEKNILGIMRQSQKSIDDYAWDIVKKYNFLDKDNNYVKFKDKYKFEKYLSDFATKKQTQKALSATSPAPAALSIPDDACHYDDHELRVLTVREMARIQSFPDRFVFRSKITTGGQMRKYEVPQYTQVGNAVPPLLGLALGNTIKSILDLVN
ncbi:DNA (cytosine-5-)-methyltransferase [Plesiomonas shigelloides]|uniref:DNA cytosine methyltransferase n=1 Tax=Plesiomonas shigelloides TaxID=703 RepID=UPI001261BF96|nr:DNA cytosine methyltransferase [Plesiomonas shigelloides]KAB7696324.1 DNA (cytosine-5-)-methyltransferase [Plesiomonas shigelloides]